MHPTGGVDTLKKMQNELPDEFGVTTENIMHNIEDDKVFSDKNAVEMHHAKYGMECEGLLR